jgi:cell wall-associated NlpC family hydrolase
MAKKRKAAVPHRVVTMPRQTAVTPSGSEIASDAVTYRGAPYRWGGGGPFPQPGGDCSGFVNWVLGHDAGLTLPGGIRNFSGRTHGPVVLSYAAWRGAVKVSPTSIQAGDLCIWAGPSAAGHIGIAINATQMISALDPQQGVAITPILGTGPRGAPFMVKRVRGLPGGVSTTAAAGAPAGCVASLALLPLLPVVVLARRVRPRRDRQAGGWHGVLPGA